MITIEHRYTCKSNKISNTRKIKTINVVGNIIYAHIKNTYNIPFTMITTTKWWDKNRIIMVRYDIVGICTNNTSKGVAEKISNYYNNLVKKLYTELYNIDNTLEERIYLCINDYVLSPTIDIFEVKKLLISLRSFIKNEK